MKKILLVLFILIAVKTYGQVEADRTDTLTFVSGVPSVPSDSVRWFRLDGKYDYCYLYVNDTDGATGTHYTDSIKCYSVVLRNNGSPPSDSVVNSITMRRVDNGNYADYGSSSAAGVTSKYLLLDAAIYRLYIVFSNSQFITGRRVKLTLVCINRK